MASIDLPAVKVMFTLRVESEFDNYIVVSLGDVTHVFVVNGDELEDIEMPGIASRMFPVPRTNVVGFELSEPTLWAGSLSRSRVLQVNRKSLRLIASDGSFVKTWPSPYKITLASVNPESGQIVLASGKRLLYLRINGDEIVHVGETECEFQIACVDVSPVGN